MTALEKAKIRHDKAMMLAQEAIMARIRRNENEAQVLYKQSFELEREAAYIYAERFDKEPIRSILYRSAASLAIECFLYKEAALLIQEGQSSNTPLDVMHEFEELTDKMRLSNTEQAQPFWISGVLKRVDADKSTIKLASKATDTVPQTDYTINVMSETLNKLVKNYWGDIINVYIKPKTKKGKQHLYELIEVN
jgi:hypothetical protein